MKHFNDQDIADAVQRAPKLIQDEVAVGEDSAVTIANIGLGHTLHIDQIGTLAELNRNLLIGLMTPPEVLQELITAGVPDKDAREIMSEINLKIFVPLREKMHSGPPASPTAAKPSIESQPSSPSGLPASPPIPKLVVPQVPSTPVSPTGNFSANVPKGSVKSYAPPVTGLPIGSISPPLQSPKYFHEEDALPPLRVIKTGLNTGRPPILPIKPQAAKTPPPSQSPSVQKEKPAEGEKMLEDHEEPHIEFKKDAKDSPLRQALRTVIPLAGLPAAANKPPLVPPVPPRPVSVTPLMTLDNSISILPVEHSAPQKKVVEALPIPPHPIPPGARFTPIRPPTPDMPAVPTFPDEHIPVSVPISPAPAAPTVPQSALRLAVQIPISHSFGPEAASPMPPVGAIKNISPTGETAGAIPNAPSVPKPYSSDPYREPIDESGK